MRSIRKIGDGRAGCCRFKLPFQAKKAGYEQKEQRHNRSGHDAKLGRVWSGTVRGDSGHPTTGPLYLLPFSIGNREVKLTN